MAEAETNNWEDVRELVHVRAGHKAASTKYETRVDDLVADHAVTSEKLCEAETLFSTLQIKCKTILRWDAEIELKIEDDAKLSQEQEVNRKTIVCLSATSSKQQWAQADFYLTLRD